MTDIIRLTEKFVVSLLSNELDEKFVFHNLRYTQQIVKRTNELLDFYRFGAPDDEAILLAAWFLNTGYTQSYIKHEEASCNIATTFLNNLNCSIENINKVCSLIRATNPHHMPVNFSEEIIRDAVSFYLAAKSFLADIVLLREEQSLLGIASYSPEEWYNKNIKMFGKGHRFHTAYALEHWQEGKIDNLRKWVKNKDKNREFVEKEHLKARFKEENPERGVQTMFRVTMNNHLKLSDIADTKANILLSVNAIIISMVLSNLIPKLDNPSNSYLIYPTAVFIIFSVVSMVLSIMATRPKVTSNKFTIKDVENKKVNILFFGNFHKMKLEDYELAFQSLIRDKEYVYSSMARDLYFLGKVLNMKYRILRLTYGVFMIGMILSVIAFSIAFKYLGP